VEVVEHLLLLLETELLVHQVIQDLTAVAVQHGRLL
jgi:hypothetical protein